MRLGAWFGYLLCSTLLALMAFAAAPVMANRTLLKDKIPGPEGQIEGACGLAISPISGNLYVSDYYHRRVDVFTPSGEPKEGERIQLPGTNPVFGVNTLDGVCGLAFAPSGALYANEWHESVLRLKPSMQSFDSDESTGVAVDDEGNIYVNDRTYVAVYDPSGAPLLDDEGQPLLIGLGSLGDAYGLAVSEGKVYVPDSASDTVKVYELAVSATSPVSTIDGPEEKHFVSLLDGAVAVDPTNQHLLVVDNEKPGYEKPLAAIYEFDALGNFLGRLPSCPTPPNSCVANTAPIDGEPTGLAADPDSGRLFVTTGKTEKANVFEYGPYTEPPPASLGPGGASVLPTALTRALPPADNEGGRGAGASASVVVQRGPVRVNFDGKLTPHSLPRHGTAPVGIAVEAKIVATEGGTPPQLRRIAIAINRNGRLTSAGLPVCRLHEIQPSTTAGALAACGSSLVGEGHFSANVKLPEQSPFPSAGKVLAFNGRFDGKPAILAHIYGTQPAPTSNVLSFLVKGIDGTYGTILEASLPQATGNWGYVTGLRMNLKRRFSYHGKARSYLTAGCPAPAGFPSAVFPLARTSFVFADMKPLVAVLNRTCKANG
jgi:DNA-binding beta-propeller fold protein YncE